MASIDERLNEIFNSANEHIVAVKGTLELVDASVEEDDLHNLILKSMNRMDMLQELSNEMFSLVKQMMQKMKEMKQE
ncbi:MAG: hypothetical protein AB1442_05195 [Nitrospirota bacterium]